MEELLHYVWKHRLFPLKELLTTAGQRVEVVDPGLHNTNAGPDFFNAKLKIDGTLWVGNVEVHSLSGDWMRHGHHQDEAYNNVVLHVVGKADVEVSTSNGEPVPQLVLPIPAQVLSNYDQLQHADIYPPCYSVFPTLPKIKISSWLTALQAQRFEQKARLIISRLQSHDHQWEDVFFITLARNFGFGLNGDAFERWAGRLPFRALAKHRDDLFQVEAIFFGAAGMLEKEADDLDYYIRLKKEYTYLKHKFELPTPLPLSLWKMLRLRPGNFPHVRIAQLAYLYNKEQSLFSRVMEAETIDELRLIFELSTSAFWETHYCFNRTSPTRKKLLGKNAFNLVIINTVVPFLYAYGRYKDDETLCRRASDFLDRLKAEDNYIIRQWDRTGLHVKTAADSQALIQLRKEYCDKKDCLRCRFGYEFLKSKEI